MCVGDKGEEDPSAHDESISGKENDVEEEEQYVPSQNTPKEFHDEEGVEEEVTQEVAEQARVSTPGQPDQHSTEEVPWEEKKEIGQEEATTLEEQSPRLSKQMLVPSKKTEKIRRLWKEQQILLSVIKQTLAIYNCFENEEEDKRELCDKAYNCLDKTL